MLLASKTQRDICGDYVDKAGYRFQFEGK